VAEKDEPVYALRYGKLIVVLILNDFYELLMNEGIDPSEH
jgi:prevent-host-death family protein